MHRKKHCVTYGLAINSLHIEWNFSTFQCLNLNIFLKFFFVHIFFSIQIGNSVLHCHFMPFLLFQLCRESFSEAFFSIGLFEITVSLYFDKYQKLVIVVSNFGRSVNYSDDQKENIKFANC